MMNEPVVNEMARIFPPLLGNPMSSITQATVGPMAQHGGQRVHPVRFGRVAQDGSGANQRSCSWTDELRKRADRRSDSGVLPARLLTDIHRHSNTSALTYASIGMERRAQTTTNLERMEQGRLGDVKLLKQGLRQAEVAGRVGVTGKACGGGRSNRSRRREGIEAPRLGPEKAGYPNGLWTLDSVAASSSSVTSASSIIAVMSGRFWKAS